MEELQETQVQTLDWEDPQEWEMATNSNIIVWEISCKKKPCRLQSMGFQRVDMTEQLSI